MAAIRRIYPTRFGQLHLRSRQGKGAPLVMLHPSPRPGEMWERLQERIGSLNPSTGSFPRRSRAQISRRGHQGISTIFPVWRFSRNSRCASTMALSGWMAAIKGLIPPLSM